MSKNPRELANFLARDILSTVKRVAALNTSAPDLHSVLGDLMKDFRTLQNTMDRIVEFGGSKTKLSDLLPDGTTQIFKLAKEEVQKMLEALEMDVKHVKGKWKVIEKLILVVFILYFNQLVPMMGEEVFSLDTWQIINLHDSISFFL